MRITGDKNNSEKPRLFFVHIQKTAGGTLRAYMRDSFPSDTGSMYPDSPFEAHKLSAYWDLEMLRNITPERLKHIRAFAGHFPYIACELVSVPVVSLTMLREPVDRTISYLRMRSLDPERQGLSPEEIYSHPFDFPAFIHNHQVKIFSMTHQDKPKTFMDTITVDRSRLNIAKENLLKIDILGLQESASTMFSDVSRKFGWPPLSIGDEHVASNDIEISQSFRDQIAEDNWLDIEFYNFAKRIYSDREHQG